jgi:hypothetical protein
MPQLSSTKQTQPSAAPLLLWRMMSSAGMFIESASFFVHVCPMLAPNMWRHDVLSMRGLVCVMVSWDRRRSLLPKRGVRDHNQNRQSQKRLLSYSTKQMPQYKKTTPKAIL